jgi:predicted SAM-dependent methyltransferase
MLKSITQKVLNKAGLKIVRLHPNKNDVAHYRQLFSKESIEKKRFYNICAGGHFGFGGGFYHPCWTNVDVLKPGTTLNNENEIAHDLLSLESLPIESSSAELIQSQFAIEHITDEASDVFFREVYRSLKPKGVFRVVVPNNELDYISYSNYDMHYFHWIEMFSEKKQYEHLRFKIPLNQASFEQIFLVHFAANASTIHVDGSTERISDELFKQYFENYSMNEFFDKCTEKCSVEKQKIYRQNHINWWTNEKLISKLKNAGFKNTYKLSCYQSTSPVMRNDSFFDRWWNTVALFVEAVR